MTKCGLMDEPRLAIMSAIQMLRSCQAGLIHMLSCVRRSWHGPDTTTRRAGLFSLALGLCCMNAEAQTPTPKASSAVGPKIQFATPVHDFGRMKNGETVHYNYVFTNVGDRLLEISNVHASCGCTTSGEYSKQVEPGKTGHIPIQFNSGNFHGDITKMITVTCNDPTQPTVMLQLKAQIWKPIEVIPPLANLQVTTDAPSNSTTVRIVNQQETPLKLSAPQSNHPAFAAELAVKEPGKEFELTVRTVPPLPEGMVQGQITMQSSSTNLPLVNVTAWANVQPAIVLSPAQIFLPAGRLPSIRPVPVAVRNNGTNTLVLTDPSVNAEGVEVQLKELQPGRFFTLTVSFPPGFEVPPGENVELTVKSNHPQFPVLKVPVRQPPRAAPAAASGQLILPVTPPTVPQQR